MTRGEEKKLCVALAEAASAVAQPGLNHAELYLGRVLLAQRIRELLKADVRSRNDQSRPVRSVPS